MPALPFPLQSWTALALACVAALVIGVLTVALVALIVRASTRRRIAPGDGPDPFRGARIPFRVLVIVALLWLAVDVTLPEPAWRETVDHVFRILVIASGAAFIAALVGLLLTHAMNRYRVDVVDNRVARRARTQIAIIRRLVYVVVAIIALGAILLTFPGVEAVGASVLASAGLLSLVAGLAAQSTLANVFAGIQLAFSDAIRVDDVVIVEKEWGRIEEITLTYVVVHIWDDRRMVLPSTHFTTTPFENWTRRNSELLGSVEFDLDWRASPAQMRDELERVLARTPLWDGRAKVLQVTDATGGMLRVRILVTAKDAPTLFDLRCFIREEMVEWMHRAAPEGLPRSRVELVEAAPAAPQRSARRSDDPEREGLFTGSIEAQKRAHTFTGAVPVVDPDEGAAR
ncbi:mechanosensitive ion channel [soil metagenome]